MVRDLGLLGLSILLAGYLVFWRRALRLMRRTAGVVPIWLCTYLAFTLVYNLTENSILVQNSIFWILYIAAAVCVSLYAAPAGRSPINLERPKEA